MTSLSNSSIPKMSFPLMRINTFPSRFLNAHNTSTSPDDVYSTPNGDVMLFEPNFQKNPNFNTSEYHTPKANSNNTSTSSTEEYKTPDSSLTTTKKELFPPTNFNTQLRKSNSSTIIDQRVKNMSTIKEQHEDSNLLLTNGGGGVLRSKSDFEIPKFSTKTLWAFLTPHLKRKNNVIGKQSTPNQPNNPVNGGFFKLPNSPIHKSSLRSLPETSSNSGGDVQQLGVKFFGQR